MLEVNSRKIRQLELLAPLLSTRYGKVTLTIVPVETKNMPRGSPKPSARGEASRVRKARDLFAKVSNFTLYVYTPKYYEQPGPDRNTVQSNTIVIVLIFTINMNYQFITLTNHTQVYPCV